jgi:hypothetical protein
LPLIMLLMPMFLASCATSSTSGSTDTFCKIVAKRACARVDKACQKEQLAHYCACEKEIPDLPKSIYCEVSQ